MTDPQNEQTPTQPSPPSRWKVALRVVIGVLLVTGMASGFIAMGRQKARKQSEAIREIVAASGLVYLDYQWKNGRILTEGRPPQAAWVRKLVGPENLDRAVALDLRGVNDVDGVVPLLPLLPYLVDLNAASTPLDDPALETIGRLGNLARLDVSQTAITDTGVASLVRLTNLTALSLASTNVTDQCVDDLRKLKRLQQLDLTATRISANAIKQLGKALPKCQIAQPASRSGI